MPDDDPRTDPVPDPQGTDEAEITGDGTGHALPEIEPNPHSERTDRVETGAPDEPTDDPMKFVGLVTPAPGPPAMTGPRDTDAQDRELTEVYGIGDEVERLRAAATKQCVPCEGTGDCGYCGGDGCASNGGPPADLGTPYCTDGRCTACNGSGLRAAGSPPPTPAPTREQLAETIRRRIAVWFALHPERLTDAADDAAGAVMALIAQPETTDG